MDNLREDITVIELVDHVQNYAAGEVATIDQMAAVIAGECEPEGNEEFPTSFYKARNWISVDERLPELHKEVLWIADEITGRNEIYSRRIFAGRYQGNYQGLAEFSFPGFQCTGTHWMPLPEPPGVG